MWGGSSSLSPDERERFAEEVEEGERDCERNDHDVYRAQHFEAVAVGAGERECSQVSWTDVYANERAGEEVKGQEEMQG